MANVPLAFSIHIQFKDGPTIKLEKVIVLRGDQGLEGESDIIKRQLTEMTELLTQMWISTARGTRDPTA